jgi:hypothetical protein
LSEEGKQKRQKGAKRAKRLFLPFLLLFAFFVSPLAFGFEAFKELKSDWPAGSRSRLCKSPEHGVRVTL